MLKRYSTLCAVAFAAFALFGCVTPKKNVIIDYGQRISKIKTIGIMVPDIDYYEQSMGGIREKNDADSEQANRNLVAALNRELAGRGFEVKLIARDGEFKQSMDEINGLFFAIASSYHRHADTENRTDGNRELFPNKVESFDYSVGPLDDVLDRNHVDALFLVDGVCVGNSLLMVGHTVVITALADRTGAFLWYDRYLGYGRSPGRDVRDLDSVNKIVKRMIAKMPEVPK
jgi:hypothetical protein